MSGIEVNLARRDLLIAALAAAASPAFAGDKRKQNAGQSAQFGALLGQFAEELMRLSPESATSLGMDSGALATLKSLLSDGSLDGDTRWANQVQEMLTRLGGINRDGLGAVDKVRYDTVRYAAERGVDGSKFFYESAAGGFFGLASPYVVSQQDGAIASTPEFLNSQHQIKTAADAEAYLARASAFAILLDDETARIVRDAARGVIPPVFVAKTVIGQLEGFRALKAVDQGLVTSLVSRTKAMGLPGNWEARITAIVEKSVYPSLDRQIAAFKHATAKATDIAGVHRLPDGEAYYRYALRLGTTTTLSPQEVHDIGLEQNRAIMAKMDAILKVQGMTKGSVGERVQALNTDPRLLAPDTDAGRECLIAYCNEMVAAQRALMGQFSHMKMKAPLLIKRVPPDIQDGASLGYMNFGSLDGSRPAIYYLNLKSTSLWPKYQLATLTAHEGLPGHAWQGAYLVENAKSVPVISSLMAFNAFAEGWALYAEQLVDEAGLYQDDPLSQIGYLQAQQFRACRLVVDTGLHAFKWTREQSIRFLVENTGKGEGAMRSETDRYCVAPGQACGYKVGHNEMLRLRETAQAKLGAKFDLAAFNDAIVATGGVPLDVLATVIDDFVSSKSSSETAPSVGGYVAVAESDPEVLSAAKVALKKIPRRNARLNRVISAEAQVVAGMNYRMLLLLKDGTRWRTIVWRKLDGSHVVTEVARAR